MSKHKCIPFYIGHPSKRSKTNINTTTSLQKEDTDDDTSDEEDIRAVEVAKQLESLKKIIIDSEF